MIVGGCAVPRRTRIQSLRGPTQGSKFESWEADFEYLYGKPAMLQETREHHRDACSSYESGLWR
jgi:hypothetical protein